MSHTSPSTPLVPVLLVALLVGVFVLPALYLSGDRRSPLPGAEESVRIGLLVPSCCDRFWEGQYAADAAHIAVERLNQAGGLSVDGQHREVELVIKDTKASVEATEEAVRALVGEEGVCAIVGTLETLTATAAANTAQELGIPLLIPTLSSEELIRDRPFVFCAGYDVASQGKALARLARTVLWCSRAAVAYDRSSPDSRILAQAFMNEFRAMDGHVLLNLPYFGYRSADRASFPMLAELRIDMLLLPNTAKAVALQVPAARNMGFDRPILGGTGWDTLRSMNRHYARCFHVSPWTPDMRGRTAEEFASVYAEWGKPVTTTGALMWDSFQALFQALEHGGGTAPATIREALTTMPALRGVTGVIDFRAGNAPARSMPIAEIRDGTRAYYRTVDPE